MYISNILEDNISRLRDTFKGDQSLLFREFCIGSAANVECCAAFIDGMVDMAMINSEIIKPLLEMKLEESDSEIFLPKVVKNTITASILESTKSYDDLVDYLISGNTIVLIDGYGVAVAVNTLSVKRRNIIEPENEKIVRGPRDGFNESLFTNLSLIRTRLRSEHFKLHFLEIGRLTKTKVCICYLDNVADINIVSEAEKRLKAIDIDGIMDSGYIQELISDSGYSPFLTVGFTERPDIVTGKLLDGRIAVLCDNSPIALTLPFLFVEYFIVNEDYYNNFYYGSFNRLLSWIGFFITTSIPAIYVAVTTFHQEILPTPLILSISAARQRVPLPTIAEMMLILFVFEILREASVRIPAVIGQTISIVGALIIGQAAVEARLISAPIIIVSAASGISSFLIPKMEQGVILVRLFFLLASAFMGLYGYVFAFIILSIHLTALRSFGIPYMLFASSIKPQDQKDLVFRAPWWKMKKRPKMLVKQNTNRKK